MAREGEEKKPFRRTHSGNEDRPCSRKIFNCRNCEIRHGVRDCQAYGKTFQLKNTVLFQEHVPFTEIGPWLTVEDDEEEYDFEYPLFVGSITSVKSPNSECRVLLSAQEQFTS